MPSIMAECEAGIEGLLAAGPQAKLCAIVGKIGHRSGLRVIDGQRLIVARLVCAVAVIEGDYVTLVRRNGNGYRQAVEPLRMPWNVFDELLAGGEIDCLGWRLRGALRD